jgi:2-oxoglutarate ferredoxin oxidoreductase subunit alpha
MDPYECFEHSATALDLADRLQTPVFVMTDLDIGMNQRLCAPFEWDPDRQFDQGKVMTAEELEAGKDFGRYKDVDGDGIPWRTLPGTHPTKGSFFTRGTTRDPYAKYSERGPDYIYNMERLIRKFKTAAHIVPQPILRPAAESTDYGVIYFGSTSPAMDEAFDILNAENLGLDGLRLRAFPFPDAVADFIHAHKRVFVVEQNRDAQMHTLLATELELDGTALVKILHYDGTPITARFIVDAIRSHLNAMQQRPSQAHQEMTA